MISNPTTAKRVIAGLGIAGGLIAGFESYRAQPYRDSAGLPTVCIGHLDPDLDMSQIHTEAECRALFREDLAIAEAAVSASVRVPLTENQRAALVSFVFNVGAGAFQRSTLLRKLNAGDYEGAAREFDRWTNSGGQRVQGLVNRRAQERALFETP